MKNEPLCQECSNRYKNLMHSATQRTREILNATKFGDDATYGEAVSNRGRPESGAQTLLETPRLESVEKGVQPVETRIRNRRQISRSVGYLLLGFGLASLAAAVYFVSTIFVFIGLGLTFWGGLLFFIEPQKYVMSDLMNASASSSLKTIDRMVVGMGYREKGVYLATSSERAVVFIPSEPFSRIPQATALESQTFLDDPGGLVVIPPGLALANLIEHKLGFDLKNCGLEKLVDRLPKVLVDDLEMVRDVEIEVKGNVVSFKEFNSIYADFCRQVRETSRHCGLGCPMCSALACILAIATGMPVLYEEDKESRKEGVTEASYRLLSESRL